MQKFTLKAIVLACCMLVCFHASSHACNLSNLTLLGVSGSGPYVITVRLCIGMGLTGITKGGDQRTTSVFFGFWSTTPGFTVQSFTPAQMVSPAPPQATAPPSCTMTGIITGPNTTFGTQSNVVYPMPSTPPCAGGAGTSYGCISTTALCGPAISSCSTYAFTVNVLPDSMRVFGAEAAGNPLGGCFPDYEMFISFGGFPVRWGAIGVERSKLGLEVAWSTLSESNVDYFMVERATEAEDFQSIGEVRATGDSDEERHYAFEDFAPADGRNRYRIVQVDFNGEFSESETVEIIYDSPNSLAWGPVGPNPAADVVNVAFSSPKSERVGLFVMDAAGKIVLHQTMDAKPGANTTRLDVSQLRSGSYFLRIVGPSGRLVLKLVKL